MGLDDVRPRAMRSAAARELAPSARGDGPDGRGPGANIASPYHDIALRKIAKQLETPAGFIRLSGPLEHDNIVNGDGLRAVLWTQGCPNHCKGCQNPETWDYEAGYLVKIDDIKQELKQFSGQAGITFCGGEPFVQAKACREIADWVRSELGWNVWSFSGFTYEIIKEHGGEPWELLKSLDALIDGPFILSQRDLSLRFRGSKNQRLLHLEPNTGKILQVE
ncbi:anaerobic ribonucleoside-triphosphate reductase activating protein [Candidatus Saccharibacteria bacterium]|nr:anaerobic ribonucleoside-triphosphate reductase activating protein [Candidatus Saccharibacteria bacterium]